MKEENLYELDQASSEVSPQLPVVLEESLPAKFDPLQKYLREISKYPVLTREEEEQLAKAYYETKDPRLAYKLVVSNLKLVVKIALEFQKFWAHNFLDLIQEGNLGLLQAVKKFDPYKGVKFSYYASFWIKAYILKYIMDNWKLVKMGTTQAQRKLFYKLRKEKEKLAALGFEPTSFEIAKRLGVKEKEVEEMEQRMFSQDLSLEAPVAHDSEDTLANFLKDTRPTPEEIYAKEEVLSKFKRLLKEFAQTLSGKDYIIFYERLLAEEPKTLNELSQKLGISKERVRQIEEKIIKNLKKFLEERLPDAQYYTLALPENL
ncbi:sigma-70 family RNA polymerase sigma factor [Thermodesulfobacterium sp. TA1]|uniref:sigma-70 family RNA polymerase sigma factor n=1 Tax=Thermodesulfobacterium sp. TA1 TaxID=2234087 RepID=UPI00123216A6|nr:RNA polymerase factor sigma-32 [Thermodesulfobacterium sp. TA1]QER42022.1 sigma-70 family RNA polymerase sigma factor [Thermodesulfobacterium sp. TA1]